MNKGDTLTYDVERESPKRFRLFTSHVFDFVFFTLIAFLLNFALSPLLGMVPASKEASLFQEQIQLESQLYVKDGEVVKNIAEYFESKNLPMNEESDELDDALTYFFTLYIKEETKDSGELYLKFKTEAKTKDGSPLFDEKGERALENADYDSDYLSFYRELASDKAPGYLSVKPEYLAARRTLIIMQIVSIACSITLSYLVFYIAIPLIFHRGKQTFGFKINGLYLLFVDGMSPKLGRFLLFALFRYAFFFLLAIPFVLIPYFVSITMMIIRKEKQTLSEYLFGFYCVKAKKEEIYESKEELVKREGKQEN